MKEQNIQNRKILVVDDHIDILNLMQIFLTEKDYQVDIAVNGYDALDKLAKDDYALVVTDICMPGMCGNSLLKVLRLNRDSKQVPVVAMTSDPASVTEIFDHVVKKPFLIHDISCLIEKLIQRDGNNVIPIKRAK